MFIGENPPRGAAINYYLKSAATGDVKITIADATGRTIRTLDGPKTAGHQPRDVEPRASSRRRARAAAGIRRRRARRRPSAVDPGTYIVTLTVNGKTMTKPVSVLQDVWLRE